MKSKGFEPKPSEVVPEQPEADNLGSLLRVIRRVDQTKQAVARLTKAQRKRVLRSLKG